MRLGAIVIDSDNVEDLSDFYAKFLGWKKSAEIHDGEKWIIVAKEDYSETPLVFQEDPNYEKPTWPSSREKQQQMIHLDFYAFASELDEKVEHAIACGAKVAKEQFSEKWTVLIDPSGHPFCIIPVQKDFFENI